MRLFSPSAAAGVVLMIAALLVALPGSQKTAAAAVCAPGEWSAEYFAGTVLGGAPLVDRCESAIDFDWIAGSPALTVPVNQFSARWTRTADFTAGDYLFTATADDGIRVYVDSVLVLNQWVDQPATTVTQTVPIAAGSHTVVVEYYEAWGDAEARFSYLPMTTPGGVCGQDQWTAEFFAGKALTGPAVLHRCDQNLDFDWGAGSPGPEVGVNNFSARWTRTLSFDAGTYQFTVSGDDGVRILLDGVVVVNGWADQSGASYAQTVPVTAGSHTVVVEYYEAYGDALVRAGFRQVDDGPPVQCGPGEWTGQFHSGRGLAGSPLLTRCDPDIDFDWGAGSPGPAVPANGFSARWTRTVDLAAGTYAFTATADDGIRVKLDGAVVIDGWTDQSGVGYTGTVGVDAGEHTIVVEYYEAYGDALVSVDYSRTAAADPRSATGQWTQNRTDMPVRSIHTTLLPNGKVLLVAGSGNNQVMFAAGTFKASVWDPVADTFEDIPVPEDMFCAGHAHMADGNVMLAGGNKFYPNGDKGFGGLASNYEFDVAQNKFVKLPDMRAGRWYPTLTMLGNGDINVVGGLDDSGTGGTVLVERFNSNTKQWLTNVSQRWAFWGLYPSLHLMSDGKLFYSGTNTFGNALPGSALWDLNTDTVQDMPLSHPDLRDQSGSVLLPPAQDQKVMVFGGGNSYSGQMATDSTYIHDLLNGTHTEGPPLATNKMYVNTAILPDRTVFETGGAEAINTNPKHETSIYDPETNAFTSIPGTPDIDRLYHSSALLLPDGRVAVFGSNPDEGTFEMRISIYSPAYLFRGPRPTIESAPAVMHNGSAYTVQATAPKGVRDVSLIRAGSVTHQFDPNARLVDVPFTQSANGLELSVPANPNLLPPGPYMLVVTDTDGVPSVAKWVEIPTVPTAVGATTSGSTASGSTASGSLAGGIDSMLAMHSGTGTAMSHSAACDPRAADQCCCQEESPDLLRRGMVVRQPDPDPDPETVPAKRHRVRDTGAAWWAANRAGLRPGQINYGPQGGPVFTLTGLGDGCDHNYRGRRASVCVPTVARRAPELGKARNRPTTCAALRRDGYLRFGLRVVGRDTQRLDRDRDGRACE